MSRRRTAKKEPVSMINIGSKFDSPDAKALIETLAASLDHAITLGRTEIGVELASRLGRMGDVSNVSISNSTFTNE